MFQQGNASFSVLSGRDEAPQPLLDISRLLAILVSEIEAQASELAYISATRRSVFNAVSACLTALEAQAQTQSAASPTALAESSPEDANHARPLLCRRHPDTTSKHYVRARQIEASKVIAGVLAGV